MTHQSPADHAIKVAFSINEASALIGLGRDGIYKAISDGRLRARKFGKRTLITKVDLEAFLEALPTL
jgi:excisionase family DNA binding protein